MLYFISSVIGTKCWRLPIRYIMLYSADANSDLILQDIGRFAVPLPDETPWRPGPFVLKLPRTHNYGNHAADQEQGTVVSSHSTVTRVYYAPQNEMQPAYGR